jgi:hypothetical protein
MIEPALDLAGMPMAFAVAALFAECLIPLHWVHVYAVTSLGVIAAHVIAAAWAGPDFVGTLRLLVTAPFYILWKFRLLPKLLKASSRRAAWIRTDRGSRVQNRFGRNSV